MAKVSGKLSLDQPVELTKGELLAVPRDTYSLAPRASTQISYHEAPETLFQ